MAFSELINRLIPQGAVMAGATPQTILADGTSGGTEPGYYDTSPLGNLLRQVETMQAETRIKEEAKQKKQKHRVDMYKTLRDAGYDPKKAYDAVIAGDFPTEPGGITEAQEKTKAEAGLARKKTEIYPTNTKSLLHAKIQEKVANGDELTSGEQRLYDEVIRKYGQKSDLGAILDAKKKEAAPAKAAGMVPMITPAGVKKLVPAANVARAKAAGWKER